MEILAGLPMLTAKLGGMLVIGELLALAVKHKKNLKREQQDKATAELKDYNEFKSFIGNDGLIISDNVRLTEKFNYENVVIVGSTGSMKTTKYFYPNLLDEAIKGSIIVIDPKGELFRDTSFFQQNVCHRKVLRFAPLEPNSSEQYNLLEQCEDSTEVCQLASALLMNGSLSLELSTGKKGGGIEWIQMAEPLLAASMLYCKRLEEPYNTIENALKLIINTPPKVLDLLLSTSEHEEVRTQYNIFNTVAAANNTAGSIKITLASNMKLFTDSKLALTTCNTTFTADQLRKEPTVLYISFPERKSNYLAPFIAPFITQMIDRLTDSYSYKSEPITMLLDEFANIGIINNFQNHVAVSRSRKISYSICLQSLSQLNQNYGRENANTILNNLKTKIILGGLSDSGSLEYFEDLAGKSVINTMSENVDKDGKSTFSYNTQVRNVINKDEIRRLGEHEALIIMSNRQPVLDLQTPYFKRQELVSCIKSPIPQIIKLPKTNSSSLNFEKYIEAIYKKKLELLEEEIRDIVPKKAKKKDRAEEVINDIFK